mmetsp:Transcript_5137/g.17266  ORF Transcript_5137/g.17266 Transcript_5137/m.17266 type:complete len:199 (+) Transcript_5137:244-840(+)
MERRRRSLCASVLLLLSTALPRALVDPSETVANVTLIRSCGSGGPSLASGDRFGGSVTALGDIDGDGAPDFAVGAPGSSGGRGAVYVLRLAPGGTCASYTEVSGSPGNGPSELQESDEFGKDVAGAGDLNGDGVPDMLTNLHSPPSHSLAVRRDVHGGGTVEILVGAPYADGPTRDKGAVYLLRLFPDASHVASPDHL